jgi:hypothetical protein
MRPFRIWMRIIQISGVFSKLEIRSWSTTVSLTPVWLRKAQATIIKHRVSILVGWKRSRNFIVYSSPWYGAMCPQSRYWWKCNSSNTFSWRDVRHAHILGREEWSTKFYSRNPVDGKVSRPICLYPRIPKVRWFWGCQFCIKLYLLILHLYLIWHSEVGRATCWVLLSAIYESTNSGYYNNT